jgi:hypothetical protein
MDESNYATRTEEIEKAYRTLGLYLSDFRWEAPGPCPEDGNPDHVHPTHSVFIGQFDIGDIAFSSGILNPEQVDFDDQFRLLTAEMKTSDLDALKKELKDKMTRGEDPFS